jgi:ATP-binding cassette subfamily C protein
MSPSVEPRGVGTTRLHGLPVGAARSAGGNAPLRLDESEDAWLVVRGALHVFAVPVDAEAGNGAREFLYHVEAGALCFGVGGRGAGDHAGRNDAGRDHPGRADAGRDDAAGDGATSLAVIAVGDVDTIVAPVTREDLVIGLAAEPDAIARQLTAYAARLRHALWPAVTDVDAIDHAAFDREAFNGTAPWSALDALHAAVRQRVAQRVREHDIVRMARLDARRAADATADAQALAAITTLLARGRQAPAGSTGSALDDALALVGAASGVTFVRSPSLPPTTSLPERARATARRSAVGYRAVQLEHGWWSRDAGPLLAFTVARDASSPGAPAAPVVLLPTPRGGYEVVDPVSGTRVPADATLAAGLAPRALQFYRTLPATPVRAGAVWRFLAQSVRGDARALALAGLAAALLGFLPPLLTRALFDHVIPAADVAGLTAVLVALLVASASGLLFDWVRAVAVLRLHVRVVHDLQLAVLDRLLRLPVAFFRRFAVGDLGRRTMGIMTIGETLGQATLSTLLAGLAGSAALVLLFWYSVPLALLSVALLGVSVALSIVVARRSLPHARNRQRATGELSALMLETLRGMAKLRVAAAESRLVARWSEAFRRQQQAAFAVDRLAVHHTALLSVLDVLSRVVLFGSYAWLWSGQRTPLSTGAFVAFAAAEGTFRAAVLSIATTLISLLELLPEWERAAPVLHAVPETADVRPDPGTLTGHIELRRVHFAYDPDGSDVLEDVSLTIPAGQFVAIVGPSGSGKSTLLRLLLGFEVPRRGSVCYDGQDLQLVDRLAVRRQLGVVLQHASLSHGDIFSNVTGNTPRPQDVVWEALRLAGIEDEVRAMPMGLMTLIPDGGASLSGGQRQRLLIARALIHRPKILLFDEATSALDSRAQRCVRESVATLHATRVVIAHRLSTVREADVIVVLDRGRIVESGAYDDLIAQGGVFARLAAQQEA